AAPAFVDQGRRFSVSPCAGESAYGGRERRLFGGRGDENDRRRQRCSFYLPATRFPAWKSLAQASLTTVEVWMYKRNRSTLPERAQVAVTLRTCGRMHRLFRPSGVARYP
ncbi:unnamed protein product, partial [Hapterophycus canaliculatus]